MEFNLRYPCRRFCKPKQLCLYFFFQEGGNRSDDVSDFPEVPDRYRELRHLPWNTLISSGKFHPLSRFLTYVSIMAEWQANWLENSVIPPGLQCAPKTLHTVHTCTNTTRSNTAHSHLHEEIILKLFPFWYNFEKWQLRPRVRNKIIIEREHERGAQNGEPKNVMLCVVGCNHTSQHSIYAEKNKTKANVRRTAQWKVRALGINWRNASRAKCFQQLGFVYNRKSLKLKTRE